MPAPWVHDFVELMCQFRGMDGDVADDVDCMSQLFAWLEKHGGQVDWAIGSDMLKAQMRR